MKDNTFHAAPAVVTTLGLTTSVSVSEETQEETQAPTLKNLLYHLGPLEVFVDESAPGEVIKLI